ncbi:MAG TPA: TonB family protein, partial [Polyangiaceae bacterium LLY-WYZ-15_(1-7)]|nr:TonB family protein [Polyangiaceae bacterium LLY-WYZ-15_(1-7)]
DPDAPEDASDPAGDPQGSVSTSTEGGLAVARPAGSGRDGAARGTRRAGEGGGAEPAPAVDRRALIRAYMVRVQRALGAPRYTRSLLRAGLAGSVLVALRIDPAGHVLGVRVHRSSGEPLLDEAALAHARATAEVPAPPEALRWTTREVVLPVRYVLRQR